MTPLPDLLRETMSDFGMSAVDGWWADLPEPARGEVIELWQAASASQPCIARVAARFVDAEEEKEDDDRPDLWHNAFYDYLVNHEVYLLDEKGPHVCTQQPAARAAVEAGFIPSHFACPVAHTDCLMRQLLQRAPGKSVRLRLEFAPPPERMAHPA